MGRTDSINEKDLVKIEKVRLKNKRKTASKHGRSDSKMGKCDSINVKDWVKIDKVWPKKTRRFKTQKIRFKNTFGSTRTSCWHLTTIIIITWKKLPASGVGIFLNTIQTHLFYENNGCTMYYHAIIRHVFSTLNNTVNILIPMTGFGLRYVKYISGVKRYFLYSTLNRCYNY